MAVDRIVACGFAVAIASLGAVVVILATKVSPEFPPVPQAHVRTCVPVADAVERVLETGEVGCVCYDLDVDANPD